jgi:hypothetical protein
MAEKCRSIHVNPMKHKSCAASERKPVFPQTLYTLRPNHAKAIPNPKAEKRDNIHSKSPDTREDRGTCEMRTSHNDQTIHAR